MKYGNFQTIDVYFIIQFNKFQKFKQEIKKINVETSINVVLH